MSTSERIEGTVGYRDQRIHKGTFRYPNSTATSLIKNNVSSLGSHLRYPRRVQGPGWLQTALASGGECVAETLKLISTHTCTHLITKCVQKRLTTPRVLMLLLPFMVVFFTPLEIVKKFICEEKCFN